jgi:hypothetical protein
MRNVSYSLTCSGLDSILDPMKKSRSGVFANNFLCGRRKL